MEVEFAQDYFDRKSCFRYEGRYFLVSTITLSNEKRAINYMLESGDFIYETMVFPCDEEFEVVDWDGIFLRRYNTVEQAFSGHNRLIDNPEELIQPYDDWLKEFTIEVQASIDEEDEWYKYNEEEEEEYEEE